MATIRDFQTDVKPNWCPGCGDFAVLSAIKQAAVNLSIEPHELAIITGIGCSGRLAGYIRSYGFHGAHGRALPLAQGLKLANRDLTVIAAGGDGDAFAIGLCHTIHAIRRNVDITYVIMDNQIYGLTKGQTSPRSGLGTISKTTPSGCIENAISPIQVALSSGATFIGQELSSNVKDVVELLEKAVSHKGFSLVNIFSPCVTYNRVNTLEWYKENLVKASDIEGYDHTNIQSAMKNSMERDGLITGVLYQSDKKCYQSMANNYPKTPLSKIDLMLSDAKLNELASEFM